MVCDLTSVRTYMRGYPEESLRVNECMYACIEKIPTVVPYNDVLDGNGQRSTYKEGRVLTAS